MVSVCLPSEALLQRLPSYLGFSYLGRGVSLHGCSSKAQPLLLTLNEGYLLTVTLPDLQRGIAPLGPPAATQPWLLGCGVVSRVLSLCSTFLSGTLFLPSWVAMVSYKLSLPSPQFREFMMALTSLHPALWPSPLIGIRFLYLKDHLPSLCDM